MRREKHLAAWIPPDALAVALVALVRRAETKALEAIAPRADSRADGMLDWLPRIKAALDHWLGNKLVHQVVSASGARARERADAHWAGELSGIIGRDLVLDTKVTRSLLEGWIAQNTARIQNLRNDTLERVRDDIAAAVAAGTPPEQLAAQWQRDGLPTTNGLMRGRAVVVAKHQLGLLASQIAEAQQRALGLTEYMWDDRPAIPRTQDITHKNRRGARYQWDSPPPGGHPKHRPGCQCGAVAVVSHQRLTELGG